MTATPVTDPQQLKAWRCWRCGMLLARLWLEPGCTIEVKCKCNALNLASVPRLDKPRATP